MNNQENRHSRRGAVVNLVRAMIGGALASAAASSVLAEPRKNGMSSGGHRMDAGRADSSRWLHRMQGDRKLLAPFFRALADTLERGDPSPLDAYRVGNPDFPSISTTGTGDKRNKICWACVGRLLVAIGTWLESI